MGLLDDAIREHLELKRRHGADPDEVARQENEALGETRRAEFARPEGAEPADAPVSEEPEAAAEPEDFPVREFRAEPEPAAEPDDVAPRDLADDDTVPVEDDAPDGLAAPTAEYQVEEEPARREPFDVDADEPPAAAEPPPAAEPAAPSHGDDPWLDGER